MLDGVYKLEYHDGFVRFNLNEYIDIDEKINKIKQLLES